MKYKRVRTPTVIQMEAVECGAASLSIILSYYGRYVPLEELRVECGVSRDGSNAFNLVQAAAKYGLKGSGLKIGLDDLQELECPAILFWGYNHFIVLEGFGKNKVFINDPGSGPRTISYEDFQAHYVGITLKFEKEPSFTKGGKPPPFVKEIWARIKSSTDSLSFLVISGVCLLLPGFIFPAALMLFINLYFTNFSLPWSGAFIGALLATAFFAGAMNWVQRYFLERLEIKLSISFSSQFLKHLLELPISFYAQRNAGEIAYRMSLNNDLAQTLTLQFISIFIKVILVVFYGFLMFAYDVLIASVTFASVLINFFAMYFVFRSRANDYACLQQTLGKTIGESMSGLYYIETIKSKNLESDFFSKWAGYFTNTLNSQQEIGKKDAILSIVPTFFQMLTLAILLGVGSLRIIEGSMTLGKLMALQLLAANFWYPVSQFVGFTALLQNMKIMISRLNDVLKNKVDPIHEIRNNATKEQEEKLTLDGSLEFRNVSFRYAPLSPLLIENLSFTVKPGKRIAFVGPSGSGKSTVAKLASGLLYPESGEILYEGKPIQKISREQFRNSIATVDQEIFLFAGTIRDNLTFWNHKIPDEALITACHDASIHEEIIARKEGYNSPLIEEGRNLSGGQRQRIEIARALLFNPSFLILDEATSALDSETEKNISDRIARRGCSALMIAHRLSTIQDADEIIVLDQGKVVQRGAHEALKAVDGIYKTLIESELKGD